MVVGLYLEADVVLVVEANHASVVGKDADQPVEVQGHRRGENRLLEKIVDRPPLELNPPLESLVRAVLTPGLGKGLKLGVGHTRLGQNVNQSSMSCCGRIRSADLERLDHRIDQHLASDFVEIVKTQGPFDQEAATGRDRPSSTKSRLGCLD